MMLLSSTREKPVMCTPLEAVNTAVDAQDQPMEIKRLSMQV